MSTHTSNPVEEAYLDEERALLGVCMQSASAFTAVATVLSAEMFLAAEHGVIWDAIRAVMDDLDAGSTAHADPVLVAKRLVRTGDVAKVGGAPYLHTCISWAAQPTVARKYAEGIAQRYKQREAKSTTTRAGAALETPLGPAEFGSVIAETVAQLEALACSAGGADAPAVGETLDHSISKLEDKGPKGCTTGLTALDNIIGGLHPGKLYVAAGPPGTGKTMLAQAFVRYISMTLGRPTLSFTIEMDRHELTYRMLADVARIQGSRFSALDAALTQEEWDRLAKHYAAVSAMPWRICDDTDDLNVGRIGALIAQVKKEYGDLALVTIDYLGLMVDEGSRHDTRTQIAAITKALKKAARKHQVPILLLSQVNREYSKRENSRPKMAELAGSSSIEQDADVVLLLHREDLFEPEHPRAGELEIIVDKHRNGPKGTAVVSARMRYFRIGNFGEATRHQEQERHLHAA